MTPLFDRAIQSPRRAILAGVVLTLAMGTGLARLELRTDGHALVPENAPEVAYDREIRRVFDVEDQIAVVVETDDPAGIWNLRTLRLVDDLTRRLQAVDGVDPAEVTSLATEHSRRSRANALDFETYLDPLPASAGDLDRLRTEVLGMRIYTGTLVAHDASAAAILVGVEPGTDRPLLHRRITAAVATPDGTPERIHVVGAPIAESLLGTHILEDLATLVPIAILVMSLVFYLRYRSLAAVMLPMTEVAACLTFVFGTMGHTGVPISLTITVLPVILTAVGVADEIHVFDRYSRLLHARGAGSPPLPAIRQALDEMWRPVVKTSLTTAVAFLSFTLSPIAPVRHFGIFTAVGVLFCMLWTLTVIPASLALIRPGAFPAPQSGTWPRRFASWGAWASRHRRRVLAATAVSVLVLPFGIARVTVQDSWIDGFAESSAFRRSTETVNRLFHGTHVLLVAFDARIGLAGELAPVASAATGGDAGPVPDRLELYLPDAGRLDPTVLVGEQVLFDATPAELADRRRREPELYAEVVATSRIGDRIRIEMRPALSSRQRSFLGSRRGGWSFSATGERLLDPRLLQRIGELSAFVADRLDRESPSVAGGGVLDAHDQISVARYILRGAEEDERRIGATPVENRNLLSILRKVRGEQRAAEVFDGERRRALTTVFLKNANFVAVRRLMDAVRRHAHTELEPLGVRVGFAGDVAVSQAMIGAIVKTQNSSLALSLAGVWLIAALLARSPWVGFLCLLPPALAVAVNFALMGIAGIPLGVATSMFSAMTLGLGVDFAIHLTERYRALAAAQPDPVQRLGESLAVTGPAISTNALVLAGGFAVMLFSQVPANGRLGVFVLASVVTCLLATLVLLPALTPVASAPRRER